MLLFDSGSEVEGIHTLELNGRTVVLMFEEEDDALRYAGLLAAQDFPRPPLNRSAAKRLSCSAAKPATKPNRCPPVLCQAALKSG